MNRLARQLDRHLTSHRVRLVRACLVASAALTIVASPAAAVVAPPVTATPPAPAPSSPPAAAPSADQRKFVADQLARLTGDAFSDAKPTDPKLVVDALLAKGPALLPALREARPKSVGSAREACDRAILLLSWGFDPEEKVAGAVAQLLGGHAAKGVVRTRLADPLFARAMATVWAYQLSFGDEGAGRRLAPPDPLKTNNVLLLARDGSVTTLSTPKAVEAYFKAAHKPATNPAAAAPPVAEQAIQDLFTAWLTLSALTASDAKLTYRPAPETFTFRKNGPRWVATGRAVPDGDGADKAGQRQLMLVLAPDGSVLTATETTGLKPLRK